MKYYEQIKKLNDLELMTGLPKGARLAIILENSYRLANILKFCFLNDLVAVPIDPKLPKEKIDSIIKHSEAFAVITADSFRKDLCMSHRSKGDFLLIYTSGSTGDPKGILLKKEAVVDNAKAVGKLHGFDVGKLHATCLPLYHCNALCMSLIGSIVYNQPFLLLEKFSVKDYIELIKTHNVRTASIVPALLEKVIQGKPELPDCLDYFITAAAPLTADLAKRFYDLYGPKLIQGYGLSEAVNFSFVMPYLNEGEFIQEYINNTPPVGLPIEGTETKISDDGEVLVKGHNVMTGYWKNDKATVETFTDDGFLKTGDIGTIRNGYLVLLGRKKEIINRGGEVIYPKDIEEHWRNVGLQMPLVSVSVENNLLSNDIGIYAETEDIDRLISLLKSSHYRPVAFQTGIISRTSVGKPQRKKMGDALVSRGINQELYCTLLDRCGQIARKISKHSINSKSETRVKYIFEQALAIQEVTEENNLGNEISGSISQALDVFEAELDSILFDGLRGESLMQKHKGLWRRLMMEFPMNQYAILCADFLNKRNLISGKILELGAGVGNTSNLLEQCVDEKFIRSDLGEDLNARFSKGSYIKLDFNEPFSVRNFDVIFATNAIHCAKDKQVTLQYILNALADGGTFVLAEGEPFTYQGIPWALNIFYGMFDGWWDIGGFVKRSEWISMLKKVGFRNIGWSVLRSGQHDLGGIIWGKK